MTVSYSRQLLSSFVVGLLFEGGEGGYFGRRKYKMRGKIYFRAKQQSSWHSVDKAWWERRSSTVLYQSPTPVSGRVSRIVSYPSKTLAKQLTALGTCPAQPSLVLLQHWLLLGSREFNPLFWDDRVPVSLLRCSEQGCSSPSQICIYMCIKELQEHKCPF